MILMRLPWFLLVFQIKIVSLQNMNREPRREGKNKKERAETAPSKERKSRKPAVKREKSRKNPLRDKMQSAKDTTDKRKVRRDFFTKDKKTEEQNEYSSEKYKKKNFARDNERDAKPRRERRFDDRDNERDAKPRKERRFDDRDKERDTKPRKERRFDDRDKERDTKPRRERRFDDRDKEREFKPRKERRSKVLDSEIMREVVNRRRATGRTSNKPKVLSLAWGEERGAIRLNKYIANSGICSRREADDLIAAGVILVNGKAETELGAKVMPTDEVRYEDKILQREKPVYILLNKPKDFITTTDDEKSRDNVMMLIEGACPQRVYPVGRLDRSTTGLLLFTNDGEMTKKLTHPRYGVKKIYQVELDKNLLLADFETLAEGIELEDGLMKPDDLAFVDGKKNVLGITLHSGKNRIVRRLFAHLGYEVEKLDRVYYAGLTKKDLPRGEWRFLRKEEINILKMSL